MKLTKLTATLLLIACTGLAQAAGLITRPSTHGVQATMDKLEKIVRSKGLTVFARIDHQAGARDVGMQMPEAQLLIFGSPKLGTLIMQQDVAAGLDLPLRVLVYAGPQGKTWISYHNPQGMRMSYSLDGNKAVDKATGALAKLTGAAAK